MVNDRNNFIAYYGVPVTTIGGVNDVVGAASILGRYDTIIVKPHTVAGDLANLNEVIRAVKTINLDTKVFGYTNLGAAADVLTWQAQVDQWLTDVPGDGQLDGVYIDEFGFEFALSTRANQNTAVQYVYDKLSAYATANSLLAPTTQWQVIVNAQDPLNALAKYDGMADPVIGTGKGMDYVLLDGFYFTNANVAAPPSEVNEHMYGRLEYTQNRCAAPPPVTANYKTTWPADTLGTLVEVCAGAGTTIAAVDYAKILNLCQVYDVDGLSVAPYDHGVTSNLYFYKATADVFND
jgi:hypothetical protein